MEDGDDELLEEEFFLMRLLPLEGTMRKLPRVPILVERRWLGMSRESEFLLLLLLVPRRGMSMPEFERVGRSKPSGDVLERPRLFESSFFAVNKIYKMTLKF